MRGLYNFDEVDFAYGRDDNSLFEAFKAGLIDYREETEPDRWVGGYDFRRPPRRARGGGIAGHSAAPRACRASPSTRGARSSPTRGCARPWR